MVEKGLAASRQRSQALILSGRVLVDTQRVDKPGTLIPVDSNITLKGEDIPYVSRGGLKLETALEKFSIDVNGKICLDVGASTGGFTDCLLQKGASRVVAVDVGYGQLAWKIRNHPRVLVLERTNIRHLSKDALPFPVDFACIDVSFISLKIVVPAILQFMARPSHIVALIKPQFEVGKGKVGKGGIVKDSILHTGVLDELSVFFSSLGLDSNRDSIIESPVLGAKGNREFLIHLNLPA